MGNIYRIAGREIITNKVKSIIELSNVNLNIPDTIILHTQGEVGTAINIALSWNCRWMNIRINYSDNVYPHCQRMLTDGRNLECTIKRMLMKASTDGIKRYDVTVQPLLEFAWSGAILVKNGFMLVELVEGAPDVLLRRGYFRRRYLYDKTFSMIAEEEGNQYSYLKWDGAQWSECILDGSNDATRCASKYLENFTINRDGFYEIGCQDSKIFFLEYKTVNKSSYSNISGGNMDKPFNVSDMHQGKNTATNRRIFEMPSFDHIPELDKCKAVIVKEGAYLSHFAYYTVQNGIGCLFN